MYPFGNHRNTLEMIVCWAWDHRCVRRFWAATERQTDTATRVEAFTSMDAAAQHDQPAPDADDELLIDALAFIGDLDFDVDDATPDEDDELTWSILADALPSSSTATMDLVLPGNDLFLPVPAIIEPLALDGEMEMEPSQTAPVVADELEQPDEAVSKPKTINRARTRRREELLYLREVVGELEQRLEGLREKQEDIMPDTGASAESSELVDAWAHLATRQYEQRHKAEEENLKLKRLLQEQISVGKSLERLLRRKRPSVETFDTGIAAEKRLRRSSSLSWNNALIFDELLADCDKLYTETERAMAKFGAAPEKPHRDIQLVHDPELGMTLQTIDHRILPFCYEDTSRVIWSSFSDPSSVHRTHRYHDVDLTENAMKLQFRVITDIGRVRGELAVKIAVRRYIEANRTVIITSGIIDPGEVSQTDMAGVRMRQTGWHIIERMPASLSSPDGATRILIHFRAVPDLDDDLLDQTRKVGTLSNFLLSILSVEIESRSQKVDNQLLELALKGGRPGT